MYNYCCQIKGNNMSTNTHYQYAKITLSDGTHEFSYHQFIPCSNQGLTKEDISDFLIDKHNAIEPLNSEGLSHGAYWTHADTSVSVIAVNLQSPESCTIPVYSSSDPTIGNLKAFAPELFY